MACLHQIPPIRVQEAAEGMGKDCKGQCRWRTPREQSLLNVTGLLQTVAACTVPVQV